MQHILTILLLGSLSSLAFADFNMRDASFLKTLNEFSHPLLERTYGSRSLWRGAMGFGWCSGFEKRIELLKPSKARLIQCESESEIPVQKQGAGWVYQGKNGAETFDAGGRLIRLENPKATLTYSHNGLLESIHTSKEVLTFLYNPERQIREISSSKGQAVRYQYQNDDLVAIRAPRKKMTFQYDAFHNLIGVSSPQGSEMISYRLETDEILSYRNLKNACTVNFQFQKVSGLELRSILARSCPGMKKQSQTFNFLFRKTKTGKLQISQMKISGDLHDKTNLP
jgi:YD repeat-containing protein